MHCTWFVCGSELACAEEDLALKLPGTNLGILILSWVRSQLVFITLQASEEPLVGVFITLQASDIDA